MYVYDYMYLKVIYIYNIILTNITTPYATVKMERIISQVVLTKDGTNRYTFEQ